MQQVLSYLRRAVDDYQMIPKGAGVAVALSGGKDSMLLAAGLRELSKFHPAGFSVRAIHADLGFGNIDLDGIRAFCREWDIPLTIRKTDISDVVFNIRKEPNPCALCAKMRRGALHDAAKEAGCSAVALGHHADDAIETFVLNLVYEGRIGCYRPVTWLSRKELTVIRPLMYLSEQQVRAAVGRLGIHPVRNPCPMDHISRRQEVKELLADAEKHYPGIRERISGAIIRSNLPGWEK